MNYIYCRISTDQQSEASLDNQELTCRKWVSEPITVYHEIESGAREDRPKLNEMISQLKPGDSVCIYDYSRISRKVKDALTILDRISAKGATLISGGKTIDPEDPLDLFTYSVHSAFAEMQRTIQAKKAKEGQDKIFKEGNWIFCSTLFGYSLVRTGKNKTISVVPEEEKVIKFIYEKYASGWSVKKLLKELQGVPLQRQGNFTLKKISRILQNPIYMSYYPDFKGHNDELSRYTENELRQHLIHSNLYPSIVDESTWWVCFDKYRTVTPTHARPWQLRWTKHSLSGIIRCPDCGKGISRFEKYGGLYATEDHKPNCPSKYRAKFDAAWLETIMEFCFYLTFITGNEVGTFFSQRQQELYEDKTEINKAIADIDSLISETNTKIGRIVSAIANGIITNDQASNQMADLRKTLSGFEARRNALEQDLRSVEGDIDALIELSVGEVISSFSNNRREYYQKFIQSALMYKHAIEIAYMNGRTFTIPRPLRHNHIIEPVTVSTGNKDKPFEFSFIFDFGKKTFTVKDVESVEEAKEWAIKDYQELLDKAKTLLNDGLVLI